MKTQAHVSDTGSHEAAVRKLFVGVDIAKESFASAVSYQGQCTYEGNTVNTEAGVAAFAHAMEIRQQACGATTIHLVIEPTGGYEQRLVVEAYRRRWLVTQVNPNEVRHWSQSRGKRAKTDRQDALMLAAFGEERNPPPQHLTSDEAAALDSLLRRQADLQKLLQSERNRRQQLAVNPRTPKEVKESVDRTIEALDRELDLIDDAIKNLFAIHDELAHVLKLVLTVPGIGPKTSTHLVSLFYRFKAKTAGAGTAKQLVAFAGLDPKPFESGSSVRQRSVISRQGDPGLRTKLFLSALGGVRGNNPLRTFYASLCGRDKPKKLALVACARKALIWAWAVFISDTPFDPSRCQVTSTQSAT